jgi:iron complex transport system ATP-binding protein
MRLLQTENLCVALNGRKLIDGLNWQVQRGEFWCVLGKNGIGKSSLLYVLAGLLPAAGGRVYLRGDAIDELDAQALSLRRGLLLQHQADAFSHSVLDTVLIGRSPHRVNGVWDTAADIDAAQAALLRVGLHEKAHADITRLSGGERQRVALAALLAQGPSLMLMDEPTAHQDVAQQLSIMRLARELAATHGMVASCHDINLAARFATHALVLGEGRHWMGKVEDILTPAILAQAYACHFSLQGGVLLAE